MHFSDLISGLIAGGAGAAASWLTYALSNARKFGRLEGKVDSLSDRITSLEKSDDVVRWSQLGPRMYLPTFTLPPKEGH